MNWKYLREIYIDGYYAGIRSIYTDLNSLIPRSLSNQELILFLMGVRDGIALIKYPEKRPSLYKNLFQEFGEKFVPRNSQCI